MFSKSDIEKYFIAEKQESLFFMGVGLIAIGLAAWFLLAHKTTFYKGLAIPLLVIGLVQTVVGYTVFSRADKQRVDTVYAFDMNPAGIRQEELPRMKTVNRNFVIYRWIEIACIVAGIVLVGLFRQDETRQFLYGLGLGLFMQAAIMLVADFFAEKRANVYTTGLQQKFDKP